MSATLRARATRPVPQTRLVRGWLASSRWLRPTVFAVLAVAAAVQALQVTMAFFGDRTLVLTNWDFPAFYAAGKLVAEGSGHLLYDIEAIRAVEVGAVGRPVGGTGVLPFFNPAFFALTFVPLSALDILRAYQVWTALSVLLLLVNVFIVLRLTPHMDRGWRIAIVAAMVTLMPISYGLQHGQFSLILLTSWSAGFLLLRDGRERLAGAALVPLLIKPELLVPVAFYLAWRRHWCAFQTLLPLTMAAVLISVAVTGVDAAIAYPSFLLESTRWEGQGVTTAVMFGWNGIVAMVLHEPAAPSTRAVVAALMLATVATMAVVFRRGRGELPFGTQWMLITIATILLDPHFYLQDTILLAVPAMVLIATREGADRTKFAVLFGVGWCILALGTVPNQYLHVNVFGLYLLAVGGTLCWSALGRATAPARVASPISEPAAV